MMGTRTGDIDPSVFYYVCKCTGKDPETVFQEFSKQSGLKGVSMISDDSRDLENAANNGDKQAILTNNLWARRVADFIGQYYVRLGGCDLIIFSAGIGENSALYRKLVLENIKEALGITYDEKINQETHVKNLIKNLDLTEIQNLVENKTSTIVCLFRTVKKITTKNNKTMAFITAYDDANDLDITLFSDTYEKYIDLINKLKKKDIILVTGRLERNRKNNELGFVMDEIKLLEEGNTQNG